MANDGGPIAESKDGPELNMDRIREKVDRSFALVPEIGERWTRWYDVPYLLLRWPTESWRRRLVPWHLRHLLVAGMNFLSIFNHYDREKIESRSDPSENLIVPAGEVVTQGAIWVTEFFPPSLYSQLQDGLKRNGWERDKSTSMVDGSKAEQVWRARRGRGFSWSRLATVATPGSGYVGAGIREELPEDFEFIEISAVQWGSSITAIVAHIKLSPRGQMAVNKVWTGPQEPMLIWRGFGRPAHVENRYFAALISTQTERQRLHDLARRWLAGKCSGFFAETELGHPVVDLSILEQFDPLSHSDSRTNGEPLRSLGLAGNHLFNNVSPQIPGAVLVGGDPLRKTNERLSNSWGVVGQLETLRIQNARSHRGNPPNTATALASALNTAIGNFLLRASTLAYAVQLQETLGDARDSASVRHRRFRPRRVEQLRRELLASSLDVSVVTRDAALVFSRENYWRQSIDVKGVPREGVSSPPGEYDLMEDIENRTMKSFEELKQDDVAYRDVLSTVASLGSSAAETRLGRRALLVAGASLTVSLVTLLIAPGDPSLWQELLDFVDQR